MNFEHINHLVNVILTDTSYNVQLFGHKDHQNKDMEDTPNRLLKANQNSHHHSFNTKKKKYLFIVKEHMNVQ